MTFDDVIQKYKDTTLWKRLLLLALLASLPSLDYTFEHAQELMNTRDDLTLLRAKSESEFNQAKERKQNLAKLEEKLALTEAQMQKASKILPDEFIIDKILQKTAMIAQDVGVELKRFDPGEGLPSETAYKYVELPIAINLTGTYGQIATFLDRIVHLELLVHIRNIQMALDPSSLGDSLKANDQQNQKLREDTKISTNADMVIFRSLSQEELAAIEAASKKIEVKDPSAPKPPEKKS